MFKQPKPQKLKFHSSEKWSALRGFKTKDGRQYAISNFGRVIAYWDNFDNGNFLKISTVSKYPVCSARKNGTSQTFLVHRFVAQHFCEKPSAKHKIVIHLDHNKENNYFANLRWVTQGEAFEHMKKDINYIQSKPQYRGRGLKLTPERVKIIKQRLASGKTRVRILAKQFGVSDTVLYRIKAGTNWGHVKI